MGSTYKRSLIKGLSWESISFIITFVIVYLIYGDLKTSFWFSLSLVLLKSSIFFVHERIWKNKTSDKEILGKTPIFKVEARTMEEKINIYSIDPTH